MKKEEIMTKATQMLSKTAFKLKKASPTIMVIGAAIGGVAATVLACKATLKAQYILAEHKANVEKIHETKDKVDSGEIQLSEGETYTKEDLTKDITTTYITPLFFPTQTMAVGIRHLKSGRPTSRRPSVKA